MEHVMDDELHCAGLSNGVGHVPVFSNGQWGVVKSIPEQAHEASSSHHSYYAKCLMGGVLASSIRWVLAPLDLIKCHMQVHPGKYPTFASGLSIVFREEGMAGLYRGVVPTVLAYSSQTGIKYMMYEFCKESWTDVILPGGSEMNEPNSGVYRSAIYILSAASAEAVADVFMCPWEMIKVQMQTSSAVKSSISAPPSVGGLLSHTSSFPTQLVPALTVMWKHRHNWRFPFGALGPLWSRQILGTVANFWTFEHTVEAIYNNYGLTNNDEEKNEYSTSTQLGVTLIAGYISGLVSTLVSHPADSLISFRARYPHKSLSQIFHQVGWKGLATQGLGPRAFLTGTVIGIQWLIYDSFRTLMGMGTTGAGKG